VNCRQQRQVGLGLARSVSSCGGARGARGAADVAAVLPAAPALGLVVEVDDRVGQVHVAREDDGRRAVAGAVHTARHNQN